MLCVVEKRSDWLLFTLLCSRSSLLRARVPAANWLMLALAKGPGCCTESFSASKRLRAQALDTDERTLALPLALPLPSFCSGAAPKPGRDARY